MAVHIDNILWRTITKIIKGDTNERAFYLVGFSDGENYYVIESFEIQYKTKTQACIVSDPYGRLILSSSLPAGVSIIGVSHSHPFDYSNEKPKPSTMDLSFVYNYKEEIIMTINSTGKASAVRFSEDLEELDIKVRDFPEKPKVLRIKGVYMVFPWWASDEMIRLKAPRLYGEILYRLHFHAYLKGKRKIVVPPYEWFFVRQKYAIPHVAFGKLRNIAKEYLLNNSVTKFAQNVHSQ
ncbi:MAG: hypothetical protein QXH55_00215 [Candidatus Korarchaeota archaeon]|nr:hypothetical protein [Thermoproteota archaeon]MCR8462573.1 hypothetical protein [Thermoproteota archaeon]MCR8470699.1 hypothetical protein [Thermoproteota archaeon]MCR8471721.1 hypothetical protein [Thermoproteota archaeon]MCR8472922.1 hypothetical protein [Thermoproteota archaeon]